MKYLGKTPPILGPDGQTLPGSIAEVGYLRLGGVDQWVMIRGKSLANPVLILLHGGPGFPEMRLFRHFNAALEDSFTVVYWEQRGTDKSFSQEIPKSSLTVEQFISDLDELVELTRKRFGKKKVVIYGHSWGSALGVLYAARFPDKVATYVGAGQLGDWPASERLSYNFVLSEAKRKKNSTARRQLQKIGPPPHTFREMLVQRKWLVRYVGIARNMSVWRFFRITLAGPESSLFELPRLLRSQFFSPKIMWPEVSKLNLVKAVPRLKMPVFFFIGRHDRVVAADASVAYFDSLAAPEKRLVWFEESAHEPSIEEPEKFNALMVELVRPVTVGEMDRNLSRSA